MLPISAIRLTPKSNQNNKTVAEQYPSLKLNFQPMTDISFKSKKFEGIGVFLEKFRKIFSPENKDLHQLELFLKDHKEMFCGEKKITSNPNGGFWLRNNDFSELTDADKASIEIYISNMRKDLHSTLGTLKIGPGRLSGNQQKIKEHICRYPFDFAVSDYRVIVTSREGELAKNISDLREFYASR